MTAKRKKVKPPMRRAKGGPALIDTIMARLAAGESLRSILRSDGMPTMTSVMRWLAEDKALREQYARAREVQAETLFDEILDIADDGSNDWIETDKGRILDHEHVQRSKLRIDARKWMAAKMAPKKYGDKPEPDEELVPTPVSVHVNVVDASKSSADAE